MNLPDKPIYTVFHAGKVPVRAVNSYRHPMSLGAGEYTTIQNAFMGTAAIQTRGGISEHTATALGGSVTPVGMWTGLMNGSQKIITAFRDSSNNVSLYEVSGGSFGTAITPSSGYYGDTRLSLSNENLRVYFELARDKRNSEDVLIIQDGTSQPRVYDPNASANTQTRIHYAITPPANKQEFRVTGVLPVFWDVQDVVGGDITNADADFGVAPSGSDPDKYLILSIATTVDRGAIGAGDNSIIVFTSGAISLANSRALVMLVETAYADVWNRMGIEVGTSAPAWTTVYDPTSTTLNSIRFTPADASGKKVWASIPLDTVASGLTAIDRIRLSWVGDGTRNMPPTAAQTVNIYVVAGSGQVPGNAIHAITYANSGSRAESKGLYYTKRQGGLASAFGGAILGGLRLPMTDPNFYLNYTLHYQNPTQAEINKGTDYLYIYRKDDGDSDYFYVTSVELATPTGTPPAWAFSSGTALSVRQTTDSTFAKNLYLIPPDPDATEIPVGKAMLNANGRLFVAKQTDDGAFKKYADLAISEFGHPFRFRNAIRPGLGRAGLDPASPTRITFEGEDIKQLAKVATSTLDVDTVYVWTIDNLYAVSGADALSLTQPSLIGPTGTNVPFSVAVYRNTVYWFEGNKRIYRMGNGRVDELSLGTIEDKFTLSLSHGQVNAACREGVYYAFYDTTNDGTGGDKLIGVAFDERTGVWSVLDPAGTMSVESIALYGRTLYILCYDKKVYKFDDSSASSDNSSNYTFTMTTGELYPPEGFERIHVGRIGIICEDMTSTTLTTTRTYYPNDGGVGTATVSVDVSDDRAFKWDGAQSNTGTGNGRTVQLSITGSVPANKKILEVVCEVEPIDGTADV